MFSDGINSALKDHSMVMKGKIEEEIAAGRFPAIRRQVAMNMPIRRFPLLHYTFDQKDFNSDRQCRQFQDEVARSTSSFKYLLV